MIFPILNGLMSWRTAPVTWAVVILNLLVFTFTSQMGVKTQDQLEDLMKMKYFVSAQGRIYAQYLEERGRGDYPDFLRQLGKQVHSGEIDRAEMLGQLAFRDSAFIDGAESMEIAGDRVAAKIWRERIVKLRELQSEHPSFIFGLNSQDMSFNKWLSYIFVHSGWFHFFGNMLFLMIFGAALERQVGGLGFLTVFMLSGLFAAGVFAVMTGVTSSPLVGASGAISGVMTLYCVLNWKRGERFFYWLFLPFRGFMGFVYLPAWVALVIWGINDTAGYLSSIPELGGVAHTAHLGGELAGLITGLTLFAVRRVLPLKEKIPVERPRKVGVLMPFLPHKAKRAS